MTKGTASPTESREIGTDDDVITQIYWRMVKANVELAEKGDLDEARRLAAEALELAYQTDDSLDVPIVTVERRRHLRVRPRSRDILERALAESEAKGERRQREADSREARSSSMTPATQASSSAMPPVFTYA